MKTLLTKSLALLTIAAAIMLSTPADAGPKTEAAGKSYTLAELSSGIDQLQKKKVVLKSRVIGSCKSGCKMWVADGAYKEGDLFVLVRAKDDAFKFDTKSAGKSVELHGFAVARLIDTCGEKDDKAAKDHGDKKDGCAGPGESPKEITFFATKVAYGKE